MSIYTIPEIKRQDIEKLVKRWTAKAQAYGKSIEATLGEPYMTQRTIYEHSYCYELHSNTTREIGKENVEVFDLSLESDLIRMDGYEVLAKVEHLDLGNIVTPLNGSDVAEKWRKADCTCQHCNSKRDRRITFVVRGKDGIEKQIGRSCIKDYCGIDPEKIASFQRLTDLILQDDVRNFDFGSCRTPTCYDIKQVLAISIITTNEQRFVAKSNPGSNYTVIQKRLNEKYIPTLDELKKAQEMAELVSGIEFDPEDDNKWILESAKVLIKSGYCKDSHLGLLAFLPTAIERYIKHQEKKRQIEQCKDQERKASEYVGTIGQRITIDVEEFKLLTRWENVYGITYLYKIIDKAGNVFIWYASRTVESCNQIKATIKDHTERDGVKQTIVTRCKAA